MWELIRKSVEGKISSHGGERQVSDCFQYDERVKKAVRDVTGGELLGGFFGGSPLSEETQQFIRKNICPLGSGYGLTETGAYSPPLLFLCFYKVAAY